MAQQTITLGRFHRLLVDHDAKSLRIVSTIAITADLLAVTPAEMDTVMAEFQRHARPLTQRGYRVVN